jgi:hypothetical protein
MMGNNLASSAQSKRGAGSSTDGGVGIGCHSGGLNNSSCRSDERELCSSGSGSIIVSFDGCSFSELLRCAVMGLVMFV